MAPEAVAESSGADSTGRSCAEAADQGAALTADSLADPVMADGVEGPDGPTIPIRRPLAFRHCSNHLLKK